MADMSVGAKVAVDAVSVGTVAATLAGWLPSVAALLTIVWTAIRIFETRTVQQMLRRRGTVTSGGTDD